MKPQQSSIDWLDCAWGGPYEDELDQIPDCGDWSCEGCVVCIKAIEPTEYLILPIYGPVNRDGMSLGYLVIRL